MANVDRTILHQLIDLGLNPKEARVYLTLLESGSATAQRISQDSHVNRSTVYVLLELLIEKDLVFEGKNKAGVAIYEAYEPAALLGKASALQEKQHKIQNEIDTLLPELNAISPTSTLSPLIKFYEGKEGVETARHDIVTAPKNETVRSLSVKPGLSHLRNDSKALIISLQTKDIHINNKKNLVTVRLIPSSKYSFSSDILIYGNKILLLAPHEEFAVIIENKHFAEVMRETFDLAWEEAGRLDAELRKSTSVKAQ
jgi:sugar-specific transcriptional regulator TrmB